MIVERTNNQFWYLVNKQKYKIENGNHINSCEWVKYFSSLLFKDNLQPIQDIHINSCQSNNTVVDYLLNFPFADEEIIRSISKLKNGKAHGKDGIGRNSIRKHVLKYCHFLTFYLIMF